MYKYFNQSYQYQYGDITFRLMENPKKIGDSRIGKINSNFVETIRIDLKKEFPIMDIKWIKFSNVVYELLWMLRGETNPKYLIENGCHIWTDDAYRYYKEKYSPHRKKVKLNKKIYFPPLETEHTPENNQLELFELDMSKKEFVKKILKDEVIKKYVGHSFAGDQYMNIYTFGQLDKIYGYQWRRFNGHTDQVQNVLDKLKSNPDDRRMIIIGHNPTDLENGDVGLPSCHNYMQFYTMIGKDGRRKLSLHCHIRSNDWFLGQPYNTIQYALLVHIFAKLSDMDVDELVITATDAHLYHIHFEPAKIWLDRFDKINYKHVFNIDVGSIPKDEIDEYIKNIIKKFKKPISFDKEDFFLPIKNPMEINEIDNTYCKAKIEISGEQKSIDDFKFEDFILTNYKPQKYIKAELLT